MFCQYLMFSGTINWDQKISEGCFYFKDLVLIVRYVIKHHKTALDK